MPPGEEFRAALVEAWAAGDAVLPLDPAAPRAMVDATRTALGAGQDIETGTALVIATSGSTGEPKGAQLSRTALAASARATHARIGHAPGDIWLSCLPWHHIGGLQVMLRSQLLDIPLVVHERFDVAAVGAADATLLSLVPTQLTRLLDAGVDLARFRVILLGGAAASPALLARARAAGAPVVTTYGMSETAGGCVYDGRPLDGVEVRTTGDGRLAIRGPMLMSGYRHRPDLTAAALQDGWLVTNDLGVVSPQGVSVVGRADDVIVTGGENVAAAAVAEVLRGHPDIADVSVVGVPDKRWGQLVVAVAVTSRPPTLAALRDWARDRLPAAAVPRRLVAVATLPMLASGKVDRLAVRAMAEAATGAAPGG
jgi:O-succinylbenzoic acid--CoA ligase